MTTPYPPPIYTEMNPDEVTAVVGDGYPPHDGDPILRVPPPEEGGVGTGTVAVYPDGEGRPGLSWYVIESVIYRQGAGTPDEQLAAMIPGSTPTTYVDPDPPSDQPPTTGPVGY